MSGDQHNQADPARHNHVTRDIKDEGRCPACDRYWEASREAQP